MNAYVLQVVSVSCLGVPACTPRQLSPMTSVVSSWDRPRLAAPNPPVRVDATAQSGLSWVRKA